VVAFYQDEMPALGWQAEGEPQGMGEMTSLTFAREGEQANVMIVTDAGSGTTTVILNVTK
jgi:hypothetical protein